MVTEAALAKRPKHRSPSYPAIDLGKAVHRAKELKVIADRHPAPISAVLEAWGYTLKSSNGLLTIAALKKFGLAADQGKQEGRQVRLTPLGYELVFYDGQRESSQWKEHVRTAALTPTIHRELLAKYGDHLPDDSVIRPYLVLERRFSDSAAREVLRVFRATLAFAQIEPATLGDTVSADDGELESDEVTPTDIASPSASVVLGATPGMTGNADTPTPDIQMPDMRTVQLPYSRKQWALLQAEFPMTSASWDQMMAVLAAMKPSLVADD